jgi:hypothetical protein
MNIDELVQRVKAYIDKFPQDDKWDELCTQTLLEEEILDGEADDIVEPLVYVAIYALTLNDSRFSQWRDDFENERG